MKALHHRETRRPAAMLVLSTARGPRQAGHRAGSADPTGTPVVTAESVLVTDGEGLWSIAC